MQILGGIIGIIGIIFFGIWFMGFLFSISPLLGIAVILLAIAGILND